MTDFLDNLELALIDAVERHTATRERNTGGRRIWRRWRTLVGGRSRLLVVALAVLVVGGSATAAVVSLTASRPLHGTIVGGHGAPIPASLAHYRVTAFPYMAVGWAGWCTSLTFVNAQGQNSSDYGCGPIESSNDPTVGGLLSGRYEYEIFTRHVAAVRFSYGLTIRPTSDPALPRGMWGFFVVHPPIPASATNPPWTETWLDAQGRVIRQPTITAANAIQHLPVKAVDPRAPGAATCAIRALPHPAVSAIAETISTPVRWPQPIAGSFEACANATFRLGSSTLAAAVLVNASDPSRPSPALPGLQPDPAHPGLLTASDVGSIGFPEGSAVGQQGYLPALEPFAPVPGMHPMFGAPSGIESVTNRDVTARRDGPGWLIAEGGTSAQRATLLSALSAST